MDNIERVMIIFWRWADFAKPKISPAKPLIDVDFWAKEESKAVLEDIDLAENSYFDSYSVCVRNSKKEVTLDTPPAKIVRSYVHKCEECKDYIKKLVNYYSSKNNKIFVFLHRSDGFIPEDVTYVLENTEANKCFLFRGGRDYIYYGTQNEGLLGDGSFFSKRATPATPEIKVADNMNKQVYQPHFNKVWDYYKHEFDIKSFEFKEDLLSYFLPFCKDRQLGKNEFQKILEQDKLLYSRAKSFIGKELSSNEKSIIVEAEKEKEKSYIFDDFEKNLEKNNEKVLADYEEVKILLQNLFFQPTQKITTTTEREYLTKIQTKFYKLITNLKTN